MSHLSIKHNGKTIREIFNYDFEINGDLKVKKNVKIDGDLKVKGKTTLDRVVIFEEIVTNLTVNTLKVTGPATFTGGVTIDTLAVTGDSTLNNLTVNGKITPVNRTITVGVDPGFSTIQSAFDFLKGKPVDDVLIILPSPSSGFTVYDEVLSYSEVLSNASQGEVMPLANYPVANLASVNLRSPGAGIRGDPRYASGMVYTTGAQLNYFNDSTAAGYIRKLGTPYGIVALTNPNPNQITVSIVAIPAFDPEHNTGPVVLENPNFSVEDVLPRDPILIRDDSLTGVWTDHFVTAIIGGNTIAYDGPNIPNLGLGATLIIMPRVQVTSSIPQPNFTNFSIQSGLSLQGLWLRNKTAGDGVSVGNGAVVKFGQCIFDQRGSTGGVGLISLFGAQVGTEISGIVMHNAIIASPIFGMAALDCGKVDSGDWNIFDSASRNLYVEESPSSAYLNSVNLVGAGSINMEARSSVISVTTLIGSYKSRGGTGSGGVVASRGGQILLWDDNLQIDNTGVSTSIGVQLVSGGAQLKTGTGAPYNSTIKGCTQAANLAGSSDFLVKNSNPWQITNCGTGFIEQGGSRFTIQSNINYTGVPIEKSVEVGSTYTAVQSTETPSGVFTNTVSGPMDSTSKNQLIAGAVPVALTINPTSLVNGIFVYKGKDYSLYSETAVAHTLASTIGPVFFGNVPAGGPYTTVHFPAVIGAGLDFTVQSFTGSADSMIIVHSSSPGVTFT